MPVLCVHYILYIQIIPVRQNNLIHINEPIS